MRLLWRPNSAFCSFELFTRHDREVSDKVLSGLDGNTSMPIKRNYIIFVNKKQEYGHKS